MQDWTHSTGEDDGEYSTEQECQRCGTRVSEDFRRVFGDADSRVYCCKQCLTGHVSWRSLVEQGAAADPDRRDALLTEVSGRGDVAAPGDEYASPEVCSDD